MTVSAPSSSAIGSTTSWPEALTTMTSRPAARCSATRARASSYSSGTMIASRLARTISRTASAGQPRHSRLTWLRMRSIRTWPAPARLNTAWANVPRIIVPSEMRPCR
jgi:hypothetical protein